MLNQFKNDETDYCCDNNGFQHEFPTNYPHLLNNAYYFMIPYFLKLDFI